MKSIGFFSLTALAAAVLSGCAVTTVGVAEKADTATKTIEAAQVQSKSPTLNAPTPGLRRMTGNFLGSQPIQVSHATGLPARYREVTLSFGPGSGSLEAVAKNIRLATGLTVRVHSDVVEHAEPMSAQAATVEFVPTEASGSRLPSLESMVPHRQLVLDRPFPQPEPRKPPHQIPS